MKKRLLRKILLIVLIAESVFIFGLVSDFFKSQLPVFFSMQFFYPPLRVTNGKIYDSYARKVTLRGINYAELTPVGYRYVKPDVSNLPEVCRKWIAPPTSLDAENVSDMGFNTVRLVINWDALELQPPIIDKNGKWQHIWNMPYVEAIDRAVSDLGKNRVAVILDMHQYLWSSAFKYIESEDGWGCSGSGIPSWLYPHPDRFTFQQARCDFFAGVTYEDMPIDPQEGFIEAWRFIAYRYITKPYVIGANILNEPWMVRGKCEAKDLRLNDFYTKVGKAIRDVNPNLLLIIEDTQDFPDTDLGISGPLPLTNVVYSFHLYTGNWNSEGLNRTRRFLKRAREWGLPLFVGEFAAFEHASNLLSTTNFDFPWRQETSDMLAYFKKEDIHWAFWAYSGLYSLMEPGTQSAKPELLKVLQSGF